MGLAREESVPSGHCQPVVDAGPVLGRYVRREPDLEPSPDRDRPRGEPGERVRFRLAGPALWSQPPWTQHRRAPWRAPDHSGHISRRCENARRHQPRYWSICNSQGLTSGATTGPCLADEEIPINAHRYYTIVLGLPQDRPKNATDKCGVAWMSYGTAGDGYTRPDSTLLILRNLSISAHRAFPHAIHNINTPASVKSTMARTRRPSPTPTPSSSSTPAATLAPGNSQDNQNAPYGAGQGSPARPHINYKVSLTVSPAHAFRFPLTSEVALNVIHTP